jgi:hypothetical protein
MKMSFRPVPNKKSLLLSGSRQLNLMENESYYLSHISLITTTMPKKGLLAKNRSRGRKKLKVSVDLIAEWLEVGIEKLILMN